MPLQVQDSDERNLEVHGCVKTRLKVNIVTRLGERYTQVTLRVQEGDKAKLEHRTLNSLGR